VEEIRRTYEEQIIKIMDAGRSVEDAMNQARAQCLAESEEVLATLRRDLEDARTQLSQSAAELQSSQDRLKEAHALLESGRDRERNSLAALRRLADAYIQMAEQKRVIIQQKSVLTRTARQSRRLQSEVWALALAVSGEFDSTVQAARMPNPNRAIPVSCRAVVIAVLFANRLLRSRSHKGVTSRRHRSRLNVSYRETPVLPNAEELERIEGEAGVLLVVSSLLRLGEGPETVTHLDQCSAYEEPEKTLLDLLIVGQREHSQRLQDRDDQCLEVGQCTVSGLRVTSSFRQPGDRRGYWDASGRLAMQVIRQGFVNMGRGLGDLEKQDQDLREANLALDKTLCQQRRACEELHDVLKQQEARADILSRRLQESQSESQGLSESAEAYRLSSGARGESRPPRSRPPRPQSDRRF
jgi:hypothetical protein